MKVLNCYAGIGGNRKLWPPEHEVTAVENVPYIADAYNKLFPQDTVVMADAHQYLLEHFKEFDFIWSSPPCPTHSRMNIARAGISMAWRYPDMRLYQEIIFLKQFAGCKWVVENVIGYYQPLIMPAISIDRHYVWSNFWIPPLHRYRPYNLAEVTREVHGRHLDIRLPDGTKEPRKLLRNAVDPKIGLHILNAALKETKQEVLL